MRAVLLLKTEPNFSKKITKNDKSFKYARVTFRNFINFKSTHIAKVHAVASLPINQLNGTQYETRIKCKYSNSKINKRRL